jgi:hypothetical protein
VTQSCQPVPEIIRNALGLQESTNHVVTVYESDSKSTVYVVWNARKTAYLVCAVLAKGATGLDDGILRAALNSLNTASVALSLRADGSQDRLLRKSFRTGDFDHIARLDA